MCRGCPGWVQGPPSGCSSKSSRIHVRLTYFDIRERLGRPGDISNYKALMNVLSLHCTETQRGLRNESLWGNTVHVVKQQQQQQQRGFLKICALRRLLQCIWGFMDWVHNTMTQSVNWYPRWRHQLHKREIAFVVFKQGFKVGLCVCTLSSWLQCFPLTACCFEAGRSPKEPAAFSFLSAEQLCSFICPYTVACMFCPKYVSGKSHGMCVCVFDDIEEDQRKTHKHWLLLFWFCICFGNASFVSQPASSS